MQKITDLDEISYQIYRLHIKMENINYYRKFESFCEYRDKYSKYYSEAKIKLRKEKLEKLNKICSVN